MNKNAVCLITKNPCEKEPYLKFLNTFKMYDVFVVIDDNDNDYSLLHLSPFETPILFV
jgi:hypothetical protein